MVYNSFRKVNHPSIAAYLLGKELADDVLDYQLFIQLCRDQSKVSYKLVVFISVSDGEVCYVPVTDDPCHQHSAIPLFCLHQPIVALQKLHFPQGILPVSN